MKCIVLAVKEIEGVLLVKCLQLDESLRGNGLIAGGPVRIESMDGPDVSVDFLRLWGRSRRYDTQLVVYQAYWLPAPLDWREEVRVAVRRWNAEHADSPGPESKLVKAAREVGSFANTALWPDPQEGGGRIRFYAALCALRAALPPAPEPDPPERERLRNDGWEIVK